MASKIRHLHVIYVYKGKIHVVIFISLNRWFARLSWLLFSNMLEGLAWLLDGRRKLEALLEEL